MVVSPIPYITPRELRSAPTGNDWLKTFNVVGQPDEDDNLMDLCHTVTALVDEICEQNLLMPSKRYALRASVDTETAVTTERDMALIDQWGNLSFIATYRPIISVSSISYLPVAGHGMNPVQPLTDISMKNVFWEGRIISALGLYGGYLASGWGWGFSTFSGYASIPLRVSVTYVNGYPNTLTTADAAVGATSLVVADSTGIRPGDQMMLYDIPSEVITVDASYGGVSTTIPLSAPTEKAHLAGARLSMMGHDLRQACLYLAMDIVQSRAQQGAVAARKIPEFSGRGRALPYGVTDYYHKALAILDSYILTP